MRKVLLRSNTPTPATIGRATPPGEGLRPDDAAAADTPGADVAPPLDPRVAEAFSLALLLTAALRPPRTPPRTLAA